MGFKLNVQLFILHSFCNIFNDVCLEFRNKALIKNRAVKYDLQTSIIGFLYQTSVYSFIYIWCFWKKKFCYQCHNTDFYCMIYEIINNFCGFLKHVSRSKHGCRDVNVVWGCKVSEKSENKDRQQCSHF